MDEETRENQIEQAPEAPEVTLPEWTGEGLGEPPPGYGADAFTDESLFGQEEQQTSEAAEAQQQAPAQAAQPEAAPTPEQDQPQTKPQGIEHDPRFKNLRRLQVQQAQELKAERERREQLEALLQQAAPLLQQHQQAQPEAPFDPFDPQSVAAFIERQVAERTAQAHEIAQQEQSVAQFKQQTDAAVQAFYAKHPDVAPESEADVGTAEVILALQTPPEGGKPQFDLFPVTPESIEVAYALYQDPKLFEMVMDLDLLPDEETLGIARDALANQALYDEFKAQPHLLDSDEGIKVAYRRAGLAQQIEQLPTQIQQAAAEGVSKAMPQQMRKQAFVETGGTGAPVAGAPGQKPTDEFDEALAAYRQGGDSIF